MTCIVIVSFLVMLLLEYIILPGEESTNGSETTIVRSWVGWVKEKQTLSEGLWTTYAERVWKQWVSLNHIWPKTAED